MSPIIEIRRDFLEMILNSDMGEVSKVCGAKSTLLVRREEGFDAWHDVSSWLRGVAGVQAKYRNGLQETCTAVIFFDALFD